MKKLITLALALVMVSLTTLQAQRNCAAMDILEQQLQNDPQQQLRMQEIEHATQIYINQGGSARVPVEIPVVFHVVYNNGAENISDAQLQSQLDVLNEDFGRTNSDATNQWSQASGTQISFCLAGITRTSTSKRSFRTNDDVKKSNKGGIDPWPTDEYLNIWVCDISNGILGYAQFPGGPASTDGVVLDYLYTGRGGSAQAPFDLGRTGTHEVGHWLNLRHIWGDGPCGADDFVSDTPASDNPNYGCATGHVSCSSVDMVENYMDYSDDDCMNLFTAGQAARMDALFAPGGFRASFLNASGCGAPPEPTCNDGIQNGDETGVDCGGSCDPCPGPTCDDGIQNGDETGVDCGGSCEPCSPPPACAAPDGLSSSKRKGGREAKLSWNAVAAANDYLVELRPLGATVWASATTANTTITATGLTSGNTYEWQVTSNCSGASETTSIHTFVAGQNSRLGEEFSDIAVYPNPATSTLFVDINALEGDEISFGFAETQAASQLTATVIDATGKAVYSQRIQDDGSTIELSVNNLPAGLYFLRIQDEEGAVYGSAKFMIAR